MIKWFMVFCLMALPFIESAQDKKTKKRLEKQVQKAREEQAAAIQQQTVKKNLPDAVEGASLIPFQLLSADSLKISEHDLPEGQPVMVVLFNPMCDHCQKVALDVKGQIEKFKHISILFVCGKNLIGEIKNFTTTCDIKRNSKIIVGADQSDFITRLFISKGIPQIMLYNNKWKLQKTFIESVQIDSALHYLNR